MTPVRLGILTISDAASRGERADTSGDAIADWARERGAEQVERSLVPDDPERIRTLLAGWADSREMDVVITTGGTGFTERDLTPEATAEVIDRPAPGIAEAIRQAGAQTVPTAWLSRGVAGIRGRTLLVNLPGSTGGVRDGLAVLDRFLDHAVQLLRGTETQRHPNHG